MEKRSWCVIKELVSICLDSGVTIMGKEGTRGYRTKYKSFAQLGIHRQLREVDQIHRSAFSSTEKKQFRDKYEPTTACFEWNAEPAQNQ